MSRLIIAAVILILLAGCTTKPNTATVQCPACGYEHEVDLDKLEDQNQK